MNIGCGNVVKGQAIVQLRFVVSSYPGSDEAWIARDKLTSLGAPV